MANTQIDRLTESALFKLLMPVALSGLFWFVQHEFQQLNDELKSNNARMERVEGLLNDAKTDKATLELRVKALESLVPERGAAIKKAQDDLLLLQFRVQDLERPSTKSKP